MRKAFLLLLSLLLLCGPAARAQSVASVRRDAAFLSAEGRATTLHAADSAALAGLAAKIAIQSALTPALGETYLEDLRRVSSRIVEGRYAVLRYLEAGRVGEVFAPRKARVQELVSQAQKTGDPQYYTLAYTLARSLPDYPADQLENLRKRSSGSWTLQDFVSREADAVLAALEPRPAAAPRSAPSHAQPSPARQKPQTERITIRDTVITERDLGRIEVEHVFSRRDTVVVIPGNHPGGSTVVPLQKVPAGPRPLHGFVLAQAAVCPDLSYGAMLGLGGAVWGAYLRFSSNFRPATSDYDCRSDGSTGAGPIWTSGARAVSRLTVTGGGWIPCTDWLRVYGGGGFGRRTVCWQDSTGAWARVTDYSAAGLALDTGVILELGRFCLSLGGEAVAFRQFSVTAGAGFRF